MGVNVVAVGGVSSRGFEDAGMWMAWEEGHLWLGMVEWWKVLRQLIDASDMEGQSHHHRPRSRRACLNGACESGR